MRKKIQPNWKLGENQGHAFFQWERPMTYKNMKTRSTLFDYGKYNQNNTELPFHTNQIDKTSNVLPISGAALGCGAMGTITQSWQKCKLGNHFVDKFNLNQWSWWCEPYGPSSLFLGVHPKEILPQMPKELYKTMFIAALLIMSKSWEQSKCPSSPILFTKVQKRAKLNNVCFKDMHMWTNPLEKQLYDTYNVRSWLSQRGGVRYRSLGGDHRSSPRIDSSVTRVILLLML